MAIKGDVMRKRELAKIIQAVSEDFTSKELKDDAHMMKELRYLLALNDSVLKEIIQGARKIKAVHGDTLPLWAQCIQRREQ